MGTKVCNKCNIKKDVTEFYSGRKKCKTCYSEQKKRYREEHRDEINKKSREYYYENHQMMLDKRKEYRENNYEEVSSYNREYKKTYEKNRIKKDNLYRVKRSVRNLIKCSLYQRNFTKNSRTFELLGCSYEEFREHIESQFEDWMNWDNYGIYNGKEKCGWEYDHIVPVSSAECEEDIYRLNHYSNIQPLCSYVNRNVKRGNIDWEG